MLSPADLLETARAFIDRIPREPAYQEERDLSLLLLAKGYLCLGDDQSAARLLPQFSSLHPAGELRVLFSKRALAHPESSAAREVLVDTVENMGQCEAAFSLRDCCEMVPSIYSLLGEQALRRFVDSVGDAHAKSALVQEWLKLCGDREVRRALLAEYAKLATQVDLDLASIGETVAGLHVQFQSAMDLAKEAFKKGAAILQEPPRPVDTPANSLSRYLHYRHNDLKVRWLVDQAALGGVDDWTLELQIEGDAFQCIERARQPNVHTSVSNLDCARFIAFLFDRPVPLSRADEDLLNEYHSEEDSDPAHVVQLATELFHNFGTAARQFSEEQVNQGIWMLFGYVLSLGEILEKPDVPLELRTECLKAMIVPFRDFYRRVDHELTGFYMWWDYVSPSSPDLMDIARAVLSQILELPGWECQKAALHGLNHLRPDIEASGIVDRFLQLNAEMIPPEELEWVEACRDGKAL